MEIAAASDVEVEDVYMIRDLWVAIHLLAEEQPK